MLAARRDCWGRVGCAAAHGRGAMAAAPLGDGRSRRGFGEESHGRDWGGEGHGRIGGGAWRRGKEMRGEAEATSEELPLWRRPGEETGRGASVRGRRRSGVYRLGVRVFTCASRFVKKIERPKIPELCGGSMGVHHS